MLVKLVFILLMTFVLIYLITSLRNTRARDLTELEHQEQELTKSINAKKAQLSTINTAIESRAIDRKTNLTNNMVNVLDIYEDSHIRIPVDIIEDLAYMNIHADKDIMDYIENQRNYWKLENQKKPYRKVR